MKVLKNLSVITVFLLVTFFSPFTYADTVVIVNSDTELNTISQRVLAEIYQNRITKWPNGDTIKIVLQTNGKAHNEFTYDMIKIPPSKLRNIWKKVIFTGTGNLPKLIKKQNDIVKYVSNTRGAIGYIDSSIPHENVKHLMVD